MILGMPFLQKLMGVSIGMKRRFLVSIRTPSENRGCVNSVVVGELKG